MAIFNSYFDITRGYTIRSICSRPWTARASACWRPPRLLWCRRCRRRCGDAGGWASTRNGCGSGRRPWWSWRRRSHGSHGKGEGGPKHCTYMEIQWNTTDIQWKHTDIYIYINISISYISSYYFWVICPLPWRFERRYHGDIFTMKHRDLTWFNQLRTANSWEYPGGIFLFGDGWPNNGSNLWWIFYRRYNGI